MKASVFSLVFFCTASALFAQQFSNRYELVKMDKTINTFHHEAAPVVLHQQEATVGLGEILDAKFDEGAVRDREIGDQELDDAVLAPLREHLELAFA